jgi:DNA end-binding protein Ku
VPRTLWNGSLSFGLVNVPVSLTSAARDLDLHFRQLHGKDGAPIEQRRFCSKEDVEVQWEEVARGFDLDGKQVILTDAELASVQPRKTRTIDIEAFVDIEEVDPIYFDHPWYLLPFGESEGTLRAYQLLVKVMESTDRAALGRFVMRTKEYLVLVRPRGGLLSLTTMLFHDEVRPADGIAPGGRKPAKKKVDQAVAVIEALSVDWDPERYTDCYRERLTRVVKAKQEGETVKAPSEPKQPKPAPDLMAALEETLAGMKSGGGKGATRKRKATAR